MAIVVEDGTVVAGANSYITRASAIAYAAARGVTLANTTATDAQVVKAFDYLESLRSQFETIGATLSAAKIGDYITADGLNIPAAGAVLKCLAATGANLTGQGYPYVDIVWPD